MALGKFKTTIYIAIAANVLIACSKFVASFFTGSTAMLAEGIHSLIDTVNDLLLLFGIKRSGRPADRAHPFGYGREIYFWSFIVSLLMFALGGGFAIYEGIRSLKDPKIIADPVWNYGVLFAAMVFESTSLIFAFRNFRKIHPTGNILKNIIKSKDPASFAVLVEDSVAVAGLLIALFGVFLSTKLNIPYFDGGVSIVIGLLLFGVALFLARETKGLLMGETANPEILEKIETILKNHRGVKDYLFPKTVHLRPESILVVIELDFVDDLKLASVEQAISEIRKKIIQQCPRVTHVFFHGIEDSENNQAATKIDLE